MPKNTKNSGSEQGLWATLKKNVSLPANHGRESENGTGGFYDVVRTLSEAFYAICLLLHAGLGGCGRHLFGGDGPILDEARRAGCRYQSPCLYPNLGQASFLELPAPPTGSDHGGGGALPIGGTRLAFRIRTLQDCDPQELFSEELQQLVRQTLQRLPEQTRLIFLKSRMEGKKNSEIAEEMGISQKTVEYHVSQALKALRKQLKDYLPLFLLLYESKLF